MSKNINTSENGVLLHDQDDQLAVPSQKNSRVAPISTSPQALIKSQQKDAPQVVELPNIANSTMSLNRRGNHNFSPANQFNILDDQQVTDNQDFNQTKVSFNKKNSLEGSQDASMFQNSIASKARIDSANEKTMDKMQPINYGKLVKEPSSASKSFKYKNNEREALVKELNELNNIMSSNDGPILTHNEIDRPKKDSIHNLEEAAKFKSMLINKFGKNFELSSIYIHQAKIIPKQPLYMIHVSIYVIPEVQQTVICHESEGKVTSINLAKPAGTVNSQTVFFNLLKREEGHLSLHKQMQLTAKSIKLEFSKSGGFLAILIDQTQFSLYEVNESPYSLMKQIKKEQKVFTHDFDEPHDNIIFSSDAQYLALWSHESMNLIEIKSLTIIKNFYLDHSLYSTLLDVTIDKDQNCLLTLQQQNKNIIDLYDITQNQYIMKDIIYTLKDQTNLKTFVNAETFETSPSLLFCNVQENYYFQRGSTTKNHYSQFLTELKGFQILKAYQTNEEYPLILCTKDGNLYLKMLMDPDFEILIRQSKDDIYSALDYIKIDEKRLTVIYLQNNDLCIDNVNLELKTSKNMITQNEYAAFCANWPYIAYQASNAKLTIISAQDTNLLHQIKVPYHQMKIQQIQIKQDDLYFIGRISNSENTSQGYCHIIYQVNLEPLQGFKDLEKDAEGQYICKGKALEVVELFKYYESDVDKKPFVNFDICPQVDSTKPPTGIFYHGDSLYQNQMNPQLGDAGVQPTDGSGMNLIDKIQGCLIQRYDRGQIYRQKEGIQKAGRYGGKVVHITDMDDHPIFVSDRWAGAEDRKKNQSGYVCTNENAAKWNETRASLVLEYIAKRKVYIRSASETPSCDSSYIYCTSAKMEGDNAGFHVGHQKEPSTIQGDTHVWEIEDAGGGFVRFKSCSTLPELTGCYLFKTAAISGKTTEGGKATTYFVGAHKEANQSFDPDPSKFSIQYQSDISRSTEDDNGSASQTKLILIKELKHWVNHAEPQVLFKKSFSFLQDYEFIANWLWDEENQLFIILILRHYEKKEYGVQKKSTAIFINQNSNEIIKTIDFQDQMIKDILLDHQIVSDGHIYFQNSVLKIRYDLFEKVSKPERLFNIYNNVLDLELLSNNHCLFMQGFPITCKEQRKLFYLTSNHNTMKPKQAYFLPFFHQRKLKVDDYKRMPEDEVFQTEYQSSSLTIQFLSLNITQQRFSIIDQCGVIENSYDISNEIQKYGNPIQVSLNGQLLVLEKHQEVDISHKYEGLKQEIYNPLAVFTIMRMTERGLLFLKQIPLNDRLKLYCQQIQELRHIFQEDSSPPMTIDIDNIKVNHEYFNDSKEVHYNVSINDQMDIVIQITNKSDELIRCQYKVFIEGNGLPNLPKLNSMQQRRLEDAIKEVKGSMYYYERGKFAKSGVVDTVGQRHAPSQKKLMIRHLIQQRVFLDENSDLHGFAINDENILTWTNDEVNRLYLFSDEQQFENVYQLQRYGEEKRFIQSVKCVSGFPAKIMITIWKDSYKIGCLWNVQMKYEVEQYDMNHQSEIITDKKGNFYIIEENSIRSTQDQINFNCFELCTKMFGGNAPKPKSKINLSLGSKFDCVNNEWILFNDCLRLSYSFMSFIMHQNSENDQPSTIEDFDIEKYDFIIQKNHIFSLAKFKDFEGTIEVFDALRNIKVQYLDLIHFKYRVNTHIENSDKKTTILEYAQEEKELQFVDMYMRYLTYSNTDTSYKFYHVMSSMVCCPEFKNYLNSWEIQTKQMKDKQILRVKSCDTRQAFMFYQGCTPKLHLDQEFFEEQLGDCPRAHGASKYTTVACHISALRVDWMTQTERGLMFLETVYDQFNYQVLMNQQLQYIIGFMHDDIKQNVFKKELVPYILQLLIFFIAAFITGGLPKAILDSDRDSKAVNANLAFIVINLLIAVFQLYKGTQPLQKSEDPSGKKKVLKTNVWVCTCIFNNLLNIIFCAAVLIRSGNKEEEMDDFIRQIAAVLCITYWIEMLKFMEMIEEMAQLVNILYRIIYEIKIFMLLFCVLVFGFGSAFFLIGQNQIEFDAATPEYGQSIIAGCFHVLNNAVGKINTMEYYSGESASQEGILWVLYYISIVVFVILLLNMLIALICDIFQKNSEDEKPKRTRQKLQFIIDNWGKGSERMGETKYIVSARFSKQFQNIQL